MIVIKLVRIERRIVCQCEYLAGLVIKHDRHPCLRGRRFNCLFESLLGLVLDRRAYRQHDILRGFLFGNGLVINAPEPVAFLYLS